MSPVELLESSFRPRMLVVGDVLLDRYLWGNVERISPEAPIPLLRVVKQEHRLGGAGSVASMLAALEVQIALAAVTGDDDDAGRLRQLAREQGIDTGLLLVDASRPTTVKQRVLGMVQSRHPQQLLRVDHEADQPLAPALEEQLLTAIEQHLPHCDSVLVSDYNKGVCGGDLVARLVAMARPRGVPVLADPVRGADYRRYAGCACITPNRFEAGEALGRTIRTPNEGLAAAEALLAFGVEAAIVTLDRDGMAWADRQGDRGLFPVRERQVYDITGAGDMALAMIGFGLAGKLTWPRIIELANAAGGLEVERLGVVPLTRGEILAELRRTTGAPAHRKLLAIEALAGELDLRRRRGQRIVMTNGCFDLLHPGHVHSLSAARSLGDCLVVGLNSDRSVAELKGAGRPLIDEQGRADLLAALECVDYVVVFDDASVAPLVERVRPDVLVKAAQYGPEEVVGHEIVRSYGGRVELVPMRGAYSTSRLIERVVNSCRREPSA